MGKFEPTPEMFMFASTGFLGSCWRGPSARLRPGIDVHRVSLVFLIVAAIKLSVGPLSHRAAAALSI